MKKILLTMICAVALWSGVTPAFAGSGQSKVNSAINTLTPDWMPPFKLGVMAGLNASSFSHSGFDYKCGFQLGLDAMVDMSSLLDNTYLRTGLQFVRKGAKWDVGNYEVKHRPCYLQIPVRYGFGYVVEDDCVFFGELGPYVALGVGGKSRSEDVDGEKYTDHFFDYADRFDFGFGFHVGTIVSKVHQISLGYDFGFLNMSDAYSQNRNLLISYTYFFK